MPHEREIRSIATILFYGALLLLAWLAYRIVEPFLVEIGWAIVLTICLQPLQARLRPRLGRTRTALVLTLLVLVLFVLPVLFAGYALVTQGQAVVAQLRDELTDRGGAAAWLHTAWDWIRARFPWLPPEDEMIARAEASAAGVAAFMASRAGVLLRRVAVLIFSVGITLGLLFFLLRDSTAFAAGIRRVLPFGPEQNERLIALAEELVSASVTATLAISIVQGLIGGVMFAVLGIRGAAVWGFVMAILALLPAVGAALVWVPAAAWLLLSGSVTKGIVLVAVGIGILGHVDNVVRPLLLSGKARLNTLVLLVSLLGGVSAFGFIGIVLGPLVAALATAVFESYLEPLPPPPPPADVAPPAEPPPAAVVAAVTKETS
jgi:predicted PurR-regulated permease PerM